MKPFIKRQRQGREVSLLFNLREVWTFVIFVKEAVLSILIFFKKGKLTSAIKISFNLIPFLSVMTCFISVYVISFRVDRTASQMARLELILSCVFVFLLTFALVGKSALPFI